MADSISLLEESNMIILSKELNEKDRSLKSQLLISTPKEKEKNSSEPGFWENGFFGEVITDFNIHKKDFSENNLVYINQANLTIHKTEQIIYSDYIISGQVIPLKNPPENLVTYECKEREVKILVPLYDTTTGEFKGIKQTLGCIILRGDHDEFFYTIFVKENLQFYFVPLSKLCLICL